MGRRIAGIPLPLGYTQAHGSKLTNGLLSCMMRIKNRNASLTAFVVGKISATSGANLLEIRPTSENILNLLSLKFKILRHNLCPPCYAGSSNIRSCNHKFTKVSTLIPFYALLILLSQTAVAPSTFANAWSKVPNGACPAFFAVSRIKQSEKSTLEC